MLVWFAGDLNPIDRRLVSKHGSLAFSADAWATASPTERGGMLQDLFRTRRFEGSASDEVHALLGPNECYVDYDDEPCYAVVLGGVRYDLQFAVNHSNRLGTVLGVRLVSRK
jgi:hypothetical protein